MAELNRYGQCPVCEFGWDAGDILEVLSSLDIFINKTRTEMLEIARQNYGYSESNPTRFTALNNIELKGEYEGRSFWQCPTCSTVWDKATGDRFKNIAVALGGIAIVNRPIGAVQNSTGMKPLIVRE